MIFSFWPSGYLRVQDTGKSAPLFFMRAIRQPEAVSHIQKLLIERGFSITSRPLPNQWVVFDYEGKQIGVDLKSGVWIRASELEDWRCACVPCSTSGAIQAVEFLTNEVLHSV